MKTKITDALKYLGLANALQIDAEGWALIPFGDSKHDGAEARADIANARTQAGVKEQPLIQRFDRASAEALINEFREGMGVIKRAIIGLPIFKGHPDATRFAKLFPDKTPRGTIADMQLANDGLRIRPVLTEAGAKDVESGWSEFSPYWLSRQVGEENGRRIVSPFSLLSIGLVPRGNIAGLSLINAALETASDITMKEYLLKLLAKLGYTVPADAAEEQITALANTAITDCDCDAAANADLVELAKKHATVPKQRTALILDVRTLRTEKTNAETALANAKVKINGKEVALANFDAELATAFTGVRTPLETDLSARTAERDGLKTKLADERKARAIALANAAVETGRISAADRDTQVTALINSGDGFDTAATELMKKPAKLKIASSALQLGVTRSGAPDAQDQITALVNSRMKDKGEDYVTAFGCVQNDPANKALFTGMRSPEITMPKAN